MTDEYQATLETAISDVLEQQAFMFSDPCDKAELHPDSESYYHATLVFEGAVQGTLELAISIELSQELAANILGIEPDDTDIAEAAPDALKELLNVICGQFLTASYGSGSVFRLSIPDLKQTDPSGWDTLRDRENAVGFTLDDAPALACLSLEEAP